MERRPKVLVLITLAEVGGAQSYVTALLPALAERYDVTVAAYGPGPLREAAAASGVRYVPLQHVRRPVNPWRDVLGFVELVRLLRRERPDLLHANSAKAGLLGRFAARVAGVRVVVFNAHGWSFKGGGALARGFLWAHRAARPLTTATICVSRSELEVGVEAGACDAARSVVIYNGIDVEAFPRVSRNGGPPRILSVGRLKAPKDFVTFVEALRLLPRGAFSAAIAGDGPDRELLVGDALVELVGERDDVPQHLRAADVFVLSTRAEGLPISIIEAMAAGVPVVATRVGGVPELVVEGETGLLVPPGDPRALADALRRLIGDPELRLKLGSAGRQRAEELFDLPTFRQAHLELYERLLAGASR
jgi:glycosyltransferase involved in cell wall biosynthesis